MYRVGQKVRTPLLPPTLPNLNRFFETCLLLKRVRNLQQESHNILRHILNNAAVLPCEITEKFKLLQICKNMQLKCNDFACIKYN